MLLLIICTYTGMSQISPGDLTKAHASLEGIGNCTKCHELGASVSDAKCLDCHSEIQNLMDADRGFHAQPRVAIESCTKCHSEHHGRNFDMVRFDEQNFNHRQTGYPLEGAHAEVDCRACHSPQNISDPNLRKRKGTYLGLQQDCLSCHDDFHQGNLPTNCISCHSMEGWTPVTKFNHETADFKLRGQHLVTDCKECHTTTVQDGREIQQFSNIAFNDCKSCHTDAHQNQLPGRCDQCHVENGFDIFQGRGNFNHSVTDFDLNGKHKNIDCFSCHATNNNPLQVFQDRNNVAESNCVACHNDPHENKFGQNCAECHSEESFTAVAIIEGFDHSVTDFPLEGLHTTVDCKACHLERFSTPINFSECKNCHEDYHQGEFGAPEIAPDCKECHTVNKSFEYTSFTIEDHNNSDFPLEGAHVATPCFACHVDEANDRWTFANMGSECIDCHSNIHEGFIAEEFMPNNDCASCHGSDTWDLVSFDHNSTDWPLTGKHTEISCRECHFEISTNNEIISQNFATLDTQCASCHNDVHDGSFATNGVTNCATCHVTSSWLPENFNHDDTRFPLRGRHEEVDCRACHESTNSQGETNFIYQLNKLECIDCHS